MSDVATAAAADLGAGAPFVLVTGHPTPGVAPLIAGAQRHLVAPGPSTRLAVAAGVALGGHRAVAVVDASCDFADGHGDLAFTESARAARRALASGWSVVQPFRGADVAALLAQAPRPALVLLPTVDTGAAPADVPPAVAWRVWRHGDLATVVAAGPAVTALLRIGDRLHARGVSVTLIEAATVTAAEHAPLIGGDALHVGGHEAFATLDAGGWPQSMEHVPLGDAQDADLVGAVLARIRTA